MASTLAVSKVATPTGCDVNPVKLVLGFVPFILFTVLTGWVPVGWGAVVGLVAALSVVALTAGGGTSSCRWCSRDIAGDRRARVPQLMG